ncbi:MAG TPA: SurA N-terminal domain-containing protein [Trebonia sp.]
MSRFKRSRRVAALGAVGLGACVVLAACSPVQVGSAAIVGNQRITVSTLDTQVSNLQEAAKPYGSGLPITTAEMPGEVLGWLVRFSVMDRVAADNGIEVTDAQAAAGLSALSAVAQQNGFSSTSELLVANGVPPQLFQQVGRWNAQQTAYGLKMNNGQEPTTQAEQTAFTNAINKAQCTAASSLNVQVSPQFGRFDYATATFGIVPAAETLSRPAGTPTPASTEGLTPAAC